jgi:D-beta-D-heptose 7-phosphate kinase/D-beta-D-heptose 1-phosphate adenosyltransferase
MVLYGNKIRKIVSIKDLERIRKQYRNKKIVFCTGCYDILHVGHAVFFNQCKQFGDILVVGVGRDKTLRKLKGKKRPINPELNRLYTIAALEDVDYVLLNQKEIMPGKIDFYETMEKLKPDFFVQSKGVSGLKQKKELCSKMNITLKLVPRIVPKKIKKTSTTDILERIEKKNEH